jgi:PAS domain S-box-containing protein
MKFDVNNIDLGVLINHMSDMLYYIDLDYKLISYNTACKNFFSIINCNEPLAGADIIERYPNANKCRLLKALKKMEDVKTHSFEDSFVSGSKTFYFDITLYALANSNKEPMGYCVLMKDITQKELTQNALMESEEKYRRLFHQSPMILYIVSLDDLKILQVNEAAINEYGYTREEFLNMTLLDLRKEEDHIKVIALMRDVKNGKSPDSEGIWKHIKKNGEEMFTEIVYHLLTYNGKRASMAIVNNVTHRVELEKRLAHEKSLKQHQLTEAVITALETERSEIGRELHDNVNQLLATTRLYMNAAKKDKQKSDEFSEQAAVYLANAIEEIRKVSKNLVGPGIQDLGLKAAIENLVYETILVHPLKVKQDIAELEEPKIDEKFKLNIFRIIQEQLNNIIKHSKAMTVHIFLTLSNNKIKLLIADDGQGFDTSKQRHGIGVANIISRVELYKGKVDLVSSPGKGCQLKIVFSYADVFSN